MVRRLRGRKNDFKAGLRPAKLKFLEYQRICNAQGIAITQEGFLKHLVLGDIIVKQSYDKYIFDNGLDDNLDSFAKFREYLDEKEREMRGDK